MSEESSRLVIQVLLAVARSGGEVTKREFYRIFSRLRGDDRTDMNYGSWVRDDRSGVLQRIPQKDKPEEEAILRITGRGFAVLEQAGLGRTADRLIEAFETRIDRLTARRDGVSLKDRMARLNLES